MCAAYISENVARDTLPGNAHYYLLMMAAFEAPQQTSSRIIDRSSIGIADAAVGHQHFVGH